MLLKLTVFWKFAEFIGGIDIFLFSLIPCHSYYDNYVAFSLALCQQVADFNWRPGSEL